MLRYLILQLLMFGLCISCTSPKSSNRDNNDSLKKYSYLIAGIKTRNGEQQAELLGTGFFFKANEGYALITAKHLISGYNSFSKEPITKIYDTIAIRYFKNNTNSLGFFAIPIKGLRERISNTLFYERPEVIWTLVGTLPDDFKINSVENFIQDFRMYDETPDKIIAFGYGPNIEDSSKYTVNTLPVYSYEGHLADLFHTNPYTPFNDSLNLIMQPEIRKGFSGSPIFFKYSKLEDGVKKEWITFGGVSFGTNDTYKSGYFVRPYTVIRELIKPTIYTP